MGWPIALQWTLNWWVLPESRGSGNEPWQSWHHELEKLHVILSFTFTVKCLTPFTWVKKHKCSYLWVAAVPLWWQDLRHTAHTPKLLAQSGKVSGFHNLTRETVEEKSKGKIKTILFQVNSSNWNKQKTNWAHFHEHVKLNNIQQIISITNNRDYECVYTIYMFYI